MSTAGHTPNFIAEADIYPFRCVKIGTGNFKAVPSTSDPEILLGVTDGSVRSFNGTYHATVGQPISLQNGEFIQLTAGGTITVGDTLIATTDGKVIADTASTEYVAQAAENATDGEVFWAKKIVAWTIAGGGGGGGAMTLDVQEFDDPEAANTWTKPAGAVWVTVQLCGAGQDGGPYDDSPTLFNCAGGNAGTVTQKEFVASALPSTVAVTLGVPQPMYTSSDDGTSSFGTYAYACMGAGNGPSPSHSGGSTIEICGANGAGAARFGQGADADWATTINGNVGAAIGPGGGGGGFEGTEGGDGGRASCGDYYDYGIVMGVAYGGGGVGGLSDQQGGNGGNGSIDPLTGFGGGGGAGGYSTNNPNAGGNGGNGIRGGGGGSGGWSVSDIPGLPGQGGAGYVRVTTICFN